MTLSPVHLDQLVTGSGITPDVITERGYHTSTGYSELKSLGIALPRAADAAGLLMPLWSMDGTPATYFHAHEQRDVPYTVYRPDSPLIQPNGHERKYCNPRGTPTRLDCHPRHHDLLKDVSQFLWITEGIKKGDKLTTEGACALALLGVENWRRSPDWNDVLLKGRALGIVYDSDVMTKTPVQRALSSLTLWLTTKGAQVQHVYLPSSPNGDKVGVDDYLLTHTLADLEALLERPRGHQAPPRPHYTDWRAKLMTSASGQPLETFPNLCWCVANSTQASTLWYDLVSGRAMVGDEPLTEGEIEQTAIAIEDHAQIPIRHLALVHRALVAQCRLQARDPIKEWLEGLPAWDTQPRLLAWLPTYAGTSQTAYVQETGRLWLVSMVARALKPGCQCRSVIVLLGDEDIGKSKLIELLASTPWYCDVSGSLEGKEAHILMKGAWAMELGELSSMTKTEENRLKSLITMCNDVYVPKYANEPIKQPRRTVLFGTLNPEGDKTFLRGQAGNTRYYPVEVAAINLEALELLREQLFAEALEYYRTHPDDWWTLTPQADQEARAVREDHRVRSVYEEPLSVWLEGKTLTCWQEICEHFLLLEAKERWKDTKLQKDIAQAMVANGWEQETRRRIPVYGNVRPWVQKVPF